MPDGSNPRAVPGDNFPPPYRHDVVEAHETKAAEFLDAAGEWLEVGEIDSEAQASELNDFIAGVKKNVKSADDDRKADKKPHDDAGKAVQAAYNPIIEKLKRAVERVSPMQTAWLEKKEAERQAEVERQRREAEAAAKAAEEAAAKAESSNDISGEVEAEEAAKRASDLQKEADRAAKTRANVKSASGGGRTASLRAYLEVEVTNARVLFMRYQDHPDLLECLRNLAAREARSKEFDPEKDEIPGAKLTVTKRAV